MNNNRGNNRRRGRGNNRQQGGQHTNRIDSRARGNAPQLLEKYKKLAHDSHLNGDRVQEEYYLQFADHYFRVIADQKQRQEEARQPRRDDRPQDNNEDSGSDDDYGNNTSYNQNSARQERGQDRYENSSSDEQKETAGKGDEEDGEDRSIYEPVENPFVREPRATRTPKPQQRKPRRRTRDDDAEGPEANAGSDNEDDAGNLDPSALPPSISAKDEAAEEKPKRRRTRKTAPPADDGDGKLEAVNG
ncbi:MAG: DUF4167 domain-containing protein [Novosphingobium sp.]